MSSMGTKHRLQEFTKNGPRVLSIRRRYVRRAEYLRTHPPFRGDIARRRAEWDAAWPEFAIGSSPISPHKLAFPPGAYSLVPPKLYAAIRRRDEILQGKRACSIDEDSVENRSVLGYREWGQRLTAICADWWPARYFPLTHYSEHLAGRFVAGCLLCFPEYLPEDAEEEWIGIPTMQAYPLRAPVERIGDPATMAYQQGWGDVLMARLNEAAEARQVLTPELLNEMWQDADEAGRATSNAFREELADPNHSHLHARMGIHWVLPLYPGLTREDLEKGASQVMDDLRFEYGEHMLREDARRLSREKKSDREIAGLMGVSVSQVGAWTRAPD